MKSPERTSGGAKKTTTWGVSASPRWSRILENDVAGGRREGRRVRHILVHEPGGFLVTFALHDSRDRRTRESVRSSGGGLSRSPGSASRRCSRSCQRRTAGFPPCGSSQGPRESTGGRSPAPPGRPPPRRPYTSRRWAVRRRRNISSHRPRKSSFRLLSIPFSPLRQPAFTGENPHAVISLKLPAPKRKDRRAGDYFCGGWRRCGTINPVSCRAATTEGSPPDARTAVRRLPARRLRSPRPRPDHPRRRRGPPRERSAAGVSRDRLRTAGRLRADRPPGGDPGRRGRSAPPGGDAREGRRDRGKRARRRRGHAPRRGRARGALPREREPVPAPRGRLRPRFHPPQARDLPGGRLRSRGRRRDREGVGPRGRGGDGPAVPGDRAPRLRRGGGRFRSSTRRE